MQICFPKNIEILQPALDPVSRGITKKNVFLKKHKAIICPASDSDLTSLRILTNCF